jgi:hypothetical protein
MKVPVLRCLPIVRPKEGNRCNGRDCASVVERQINGQRAEEVVEANPVPDEATSTVEENMKMVNRSHNRCDAIDHTLNTVLIYGA